MSGEGRHSLLVYTNRVTNGCRAWRAASCSFQVPVSRGQHKTSATLCCSSTVLTTQYNIQYNSVLSTVQLSTVQCTVQHSTPKTFPGSTHQRAAQELVAWRSGNTFHPINEVTLRRAILVLGCVTACGQVNHLSM